jgi:hypothetical protein
MILDMIPIYTAFCPHCRGITNLEVSIALTVVTEQDGEKKIVTSRIYHCETCHMFVRGAEDESFLMGYFD